MAKPLFLVITRMHATIKREETDEYRVNWQTGQEESEYFPLKTCGVLLMHGYREKYATGYKRAVFNQIKEAVENARINAQLNLDDYDKFYLLYHATDRVVLAAEDVAQALGRSELTIEKYSADPVAGKTLGPWVDGALRQLNFPEELVKEVESCRTAPPEDDRQPATSLERDDIRVAFSHLKHQIGHLFLPLSIDLQGMESVAGAERLAYADEILKDRPKTDCLKQRFANLRFLVAGVDDGNGKTVTDDSLLYGYSIWNWLANDGLEGSETAKNLLALSGMMLNGNQPVVDRNSEVARYFYALDDVREARNLMAAMIAPFRIELSNDPTTKFGFEMWLQKLDSTLDELRGMLVNRSNQKQELVRNAG